MIVLAAKFTGKPERRLDLLELAQSMLAPSRAEAGCLSYNFYEQQFGSNEFFFFEEWTDQPTLDVHVQTPHFANFMKHFPDLITGKPSIRVYDAASMKEL
jgi:quinol monooxygenase YgiN